MAAIAAGGEATQREVRVNVGAACSQRLARKPLLHPLEGFQRYDALMLAFAQGHIPFFAFDMARIDGVGQNAFDLLIGNEAMTADRELRMGFEEALHLRL
nr:hypothetical protein [Novosphingobium sp. KN65.2]